MFVKKTLTQLETLVGDDLLLELDGEAISGTLVPVPCEARLVFAFESEESGMIGRVRFDELPRKKLKQPILKANKYSKGGYFKECPETGHLYSHLFDYMNP